MKRLMRLILLTVCLPLFCGGCQAMKRMLNDEPRKRPLRKRAVQSSASREVFPGSRSHSKRPSMLDGELSDQERATLRASERDNRLPGRDYSKQSREDKAAADWVFGR